MPEHGKDLREVLADIAKRKKLAADVRFGRDSSSRSAEAPREVYVAGCQSIATALAADGYTYARSGFTLRRKSREFTFQIRFQSSQNNTPGELVLLWIFARVLSPTLKKWRTAHACLRRGSDHVAGGQIGNLVPNHSWMEWNLAIASERNEQIEDAVATIKRVGYPYFAMFDDTERLVDLLVRESPPSFDPASALDFLMCFASRSKALQAARRMLRELPGAKEKYSVELARFRRDGLPHPTLTAHGEVLAAATIIHGFPDLSA